MGATWQTKMDCFTEFDEHTFHSLLNLEHRRCLRSGLDFHVLLCRLSTEEGARFRITGSVKSVLLSAIRESLCKTDHIGWFLQDLVLGVLLLGSDSRHSVISSNAEMSQVRRFIENQLSHTYPSLVLQFYDYLDLPLIQQYDPTNATARDFVQ